MIEIEFYDKADGSCPLQEYLDSLEPKLLAKTLRTIDMLENNGIALRGPYSEPLGDGVFELRTKQGSDITRVLYFFFKGNKAILTNGFTKKTYKTPKSELELASTSLIKFWIVKRRMIFRECCAGNVGVAVATLRIPVQCYREIRQA